MALGRDVFIPIVCCGKVVTQIRYCCWYDVIVMIAIMRDRLGYGIATAYRDQLPPMKHTLRLLPLGNG